MSHRCSYSCYRRRRRTRRVCAETISALNCDPESRADFTCWRARARASTTTNSWSRATSTSPAGKRLVVVRAVRRGRARLFRATSGRDRPRKPVSRRCRETLSAVTSTDRRHLFSVVRTPEKRQMRLCFPRTKKKKKKSSKKQEAEVHPSSYYTTTTDETKYVIVYYTRKRAISISINVYTLILSWLANGTRHRVLAEVFFFFFLQFITHRRTVYTQMKFSDRREH